jgi:hypothetical protein
MRHAGGKFDALRSTIATAARVTVDEHSGTVFARWKPFPRSAVSPPMRFPERPLFRKGRVDPNRSLKRVDQRAHRLRHQVSGVLTEMQAGAALHLHYEQGQSLWRLSSGSVVPAGVALIVITQDIVAPVGDALFHDVPSQTWRCAYA